MFQFERSFMKLKTVSLEINTVSPLLEDVEVNKTSDQITNTYKSAIESTRTCAPLSVCFDGSDYWLFDGHHRLAAMKSLGFNTCKVTIYKGTRRDAFRRYIKDKLRCQGRSSSGVFSHCLRILDEDPEWSKTDNKTLSTLFGRSPEFFTKIQMFRAQNPAGSVVRLSINKHGSISFVMIK